MYSQSLILLVILISTSTSQVLCPKDFASAVEATLGKFKDDLEGSQFALKFDYLRSDGSAEPLYSSQATTFMLPASNNKLPTCSANWLAFGDTYTYKTELTYDSQAKSVTIHLAGDPSLSLSSLESAVKELKDKGMGPVEEVIVNGCAFSGDPFPSSWAWGDLCEGYGTPPFPAVLDENTLLISVSKGPSQQIALNYSSAAHQYAASDFVISRASVENVPTSLTSISGHYHLGEKFYSIDGILSIYQSDPVLLSASIQQPDVFLGRVVAYLISPSHVPSVRIFQCSLLSPKGSATLSSVIRSAPLKDLLRHTLKESDNLYAELFAKNLGGSTAEGVKKAYELLSNRFDLNASMGFHFYQTDGSGLSRQNMMTAQSLSLLLQSLATKLPSDQFSTFLHFLPIAGVDGTLANRFVNTTAQGIVFAKTGTLTRVSALSGYLHHSQFPTTVFSLLLNQTPLSTARQHEILDELVLLLPRLRLC